MKLKLVKNRREGTTTLAIRTTKRETLEYAQAELLKMMGDSFLPFSYELDDKNGASLAYDITDMIPLETYLEAELSLLQFRAMLDDVINVMEACAEHGLDTARLVLDPKLVRLNADTNRMAFAYVPVNGLPDGRETAMDLLTFIAQRASFVCQENTHDAEMLLDYLKRQTVFSSIEFKTFLESTAFRKGASTSFAIPAAPLDKPVEPVAHKAYDFVKAQSGALSAHEARAQQSFAEKVAFDVSEAPSGPVAHASKPALAPIPTPMSTPAPMPTTAPMPVPTPAPTPGEFPTDKHIETPAVEPPTAECAHDDASPSTSFLGSGQLHGAFPQQVASSGFAILRLTNGLRHHIDFNRPTTLGRSKRSTVHISGNPGISRTHAVLTVDNGACVIEDQGSTNGTFVEGVALAPFVPTALPRGTEFTLGDETFRLE